jgi:hypothetical protein
MDNTTILNHLQGLINKPIKTTVSPLVWRKLSRLGFVAEGYSNSVVVTEAGHKFMQVTDKELSV